MLDIQPNQSPATAPSLQQTRNGISQNWTDIDRAFMVNHVEINTFGEGKHKFIQMPNLAVISPNFPVTAVGEVGLYAGNGVGNVPTLFFKPQNSPNTTAGYNVAQSTNVGSHFWAQLPSGIIMKWGQVGIGLGENTINFVSGPGIPTFNAIIPPSSVQLTIFNPAGTVGQTVTISVVTNTQIKFFSSVTVVGYQVYYFAIGN